MEPSRVEETEQVSPASSSTNLSSPLYDDSGNTSDHSSLQPKQPKPDFVPFQGDDISFLPVHLPPENTEIKSYSTLFNHLQQSALLFKAFQELFRIFHFDVKS
jgi:hypothetical protein